MKKIALMASSSNNALIKIKKRCDRVIESCDGKIKNSTYHLDLELKELTENQLKDNYALIGSITKEKNRGKK